MLSATTPNINTINSIALLGLVTQYDEPCLVCEPHDSSN